MKRNYIGLSDSFRDSAICIVNADGEVVFAEAAERWLQDKRAYGAVPEPFMRMQELIEQYCDPGAELVVASSWSDAAATVLHQEQLRLRLIATKPDPHDSEDDELAQSLLAGAVFAVDAQLATLGQRGLGSGLAISRLGRHIGRKVTRRAYEHHLVHAATACYTSPFKEGVCAILDDLGEGRSAACYTYRNGELQEIAPKYAPVAGLARLYEMVCQLCDFDPMAGEAWKVMGLAPYGRPNDRLLQLLRSVIRVDQLQIDFSPSSSALRILKEAARDAAAGDGGMANIARAGQTVFVDVLMEFLNRLHALTGSDHLIYGGECALNSSANGRILERTPFKALHVFSAPADDGNAIGAALLAFRSDHPGHRFKAKFRTPYLGSRLSPVTLRNVLESSRLPGMRRCSDAPAEAARLLAQGKIIGWLQGAAEIGPRALGNRSILADPRHPDVKDTINAGVKFREGFRPFAPAILHEFGPDYFENYQFSPYMERPLQFRRSVRDKVPGVVHVDGTGRLQSVTSNVNPQLHRLISQFHHLTGIPLVLNTSFNVMGKPIAHSVEDALAVFYTSGLDALFMDDVLIEKSID